VKRVVARRVGCAVGQAGCFRHGGQKTDANGERQFAPMLECCNRESGNRFSAVLIVLIEQGCHGAFGEAAP
jgi:hypothetical protein